MGHFTVFKTHKIIFVRILVSQSYDKMSDKQRKVELLCHGNERRLLASLLCLEHLHDFISSPSTCICSTGSRGSVGSLVKCGTCICSRGSRGSVGSLVKCGTCICSPGSRGVTAQMWSTIMLLFISVVQGVNACKQVLSASSFKQH